MFKSLSIFFGSIICWGITYTLDYDDSKYDSEVITNHNSGIIVVIEGNQLLGYLQNVLDNICSPLYQYPSELRLLSEFDCDSQVRSKHSQVYSMFSLALQCVPKLITIPPMVLLCQSQQIPVTPNAGQNSHLWSYFLQKLILLCSYFTFSQRLLEATSD